LGGSCPVSSSIWLTSCSYTCSREPRYVY
jgi:hypothetical protein